MPIHRAANREGIADRFDDPMVAASIQVDSNLLDSLHQQILFVERQITDQVRSHDPVTVQLLRTISGIGKTLACTILYEVGDVGRFPSVGKFISYARLVKCSHESVGKRTGGKNNKIGNAHLKWAFSEAACLLLRESAETKAWHQKLVSKYGKAKSLSIIPESTRGTNRNSFQQFMSTITAVVEMTGADRGKKMRPSVASRPKSLSD